MTTVRYINLFGVALLLTGFLGFLQPCIAQVSSDSTKQKRALLPWEKEHGLARHMMLTRIKRIRKITLHPSKPTTGILRGLVIAYGHPIRPPYDIKYEGNQLFVNDVQVDPSLFPEVNAPIVPSNKTPEQKQRSLKEFELRKQIKLFYSDRLKTDSLERVQAEILAVVRRSSDVYTNPIWIDKKTLDVELIGSGFREEINFSEHVSPPISPEERQKREDEGVQKAHEADMESIRTQLENDYSVIFLSVGGRAGNAALKAKVNSVMLEHGRSREQRIEGIYAVLRNYDGAIDIVDNYDQAEWR